MDKNRVLLRLELLKLTYRPGADHAAREAVAEAQGLEAYCLSPVESEQVDKEPDQKPRSAGAPKPRKSDNSIFT